MAEMENMMALMTQKLTEPGTIDGTQGPWDLSSTYFTASERYDKHHTYK